MTGLIIGIVVGLLAIILIFLLIYASRYVKAGPNEVLVISGRRHRIEDPKTGEVDYIGFRISKGGGTFVWPVLEKCELLSLEIMTIDVKTPEVYTITGVPVTVDGVAQMKVKGDDVSIRTAAEQFLSKSPAEIQKVALETLEGHLRAIIGQMTVEDLYKNREVFSQKVQSESATDFANMGLQIVSFTIREIRDSQGYLDALGKPRTAEVQRDAEIGKAKAQRDQQIQIAEAQRDAQIRSAVAMQEAKKQIYQSEAEVAQYQRDYEKKRADYQAEVNVRKAESDLAYDLQKNKTQQLVKLEEMKVIEVEKERQIEIKQKELQATIQKPAEAERYRVEQIAEAAKYQRIAEAEAAAASAQKVGVGEAEAIKAKGLGEAEAIKAKGLAEAEIILAKGQAEAEAMRKKAEAWRAYNEAAIAQMFIERLPELARAIAEPLGRTDKITIVSTGNGHDGVGASKLTKDIVDIIAQLPPVLEGVSGVNLKDLISRLPQVGGRIDGGKK